MDLLLYKCTVAEDRIVVQRTLIPHPRVKCMILNQLNGHSDVLTIFQRLTLP